MTPSMSQQIQIILTKHVTSSTKRTFTPHIVQTEDSLTKPRNLNASKYMMTKVELCYFGILGNCVADCSSAIVSPWQPSLTLGPLFRQKFSDFGLITEHQV